ncbi:CGNR zinc finger domain-containing protein [Pseudomonas typographi]|uniref:Zinc finger CGNR domain-containing protein n=1 Tax=Pseudomonas typographi TaxID=2715964 RepID=A0ABR7Z1H9_9PSED|nr:ABATE domain-containing protein [Pseudomonas typographi]MBD1551453.1 hypothetical protein [Pseudomonas typographi]MBD1587561.1 hypothetical protein [Pseudomonas typographi]MBD1599356.1 hypothetical protein [Pseudomonas typographi]
MHQNPAEPFVIADHPVLDMLNTVSQVDGQAQDEWRSADDVLHWCERLGMTLALPATYNPGELLAQARTLREAVRALVCRRQAGEPADPAPLNGFLRHAASYPQVAWAADGGVTLYRVGGPPTLAQALAPMAEAAAQLLVEGDFRRVRQCQHPDCILWFYDRTKAQRRRWCSMALCGNRHKVAAHRNRQKLIN